MEGRCAECGLDFEWRLIHSNATHPWLFEYHWRRRPSRSLCRTVAMLCRPRRFWSSIDLTDPVHLRPALLIALLALVLPLVLRVIGSLTCLVAYAKYSPPTAWSGPGMTTVELLWEAISTSFWVVYYYDDYYFYSRHTSWLVHVSQVALWWFALAWVPLTALCFRLIPVSMRRIRVQPMHIRRVAVYGVAWLSIPLVAMAALEMLALLANSISLWGTGQPLYDWWTQWTVPLTVGVIPTLPLVFAPFVYWWWAAACRWYLKLPDSRLTAAMLTLLSGLITLGGFVFLAEMLGEHGWWMGKL